MGWFIFGSLTIFLVFLIRVGIKITNSEIEYDKQLLEDYHKGLIHSPSGYGSSTYAWTGIIVYWAIVVGVFIAVIGTLVGAMK